MLWMNFAFLFTFLDLHPSLYPSSSSSASSSGSSFPSSSHLAAGMASLAALQTVVYYRFQAQYWVFISVYASLVAGIVAWSLYFSHLVPTERAGFNYPLRRQLFRLSITSYLFVGFALWAYEMSACDSLLPLYALTRGCTFHVLWHLGASMGTYLEILFLIQLTVEGRGQSARLAWMWGCFPVIRIEDKGE